MIYAIYAYLCNVDHVHVLLSTECPRGARRNQAQQEFLHLSVSLLLQPTGNEAESAPSMAFSTISCEACNFFFKASSRSAAWG